MTNQGLYPCLYLKNGTYTNLTYNLPKTLFSHMQPYPTKATLQNFTKHRNVFKKLIKHQKREMVLLLHYTAVIRIRILKGSLNFPGTIYLTKYYLFDYYNYYLQL